MYQDYDRDRGWNRFDEDEGRWGRGGERGLGRWRGREDYESGRGGWSGGAFGEGWRAERGYGGGRGSLGEPWRGEPWRGEPWRGEPWRGEPWRGGRSEWGGRPEGRGDWGGWREGRGDWSGWQGGPDWEAESRGQTGAYGQGARFNPPHWDEDRESEMGRGGFFGRRWDREGYSGGRPGARESTWTGERGGWGRGSDWGRGSAGGGVWSGAGGPGGWTGWPVGSSYEGRGPKGYRRSDDRIREDVCEMLTRHPAIDASEIEIDVQGGEVTLKGTVDSRQAKRWAEEAIEDIAGVKDVHNQLRASLDVADRGGTMTGGTTTGATPNRAGRATMPH